MDEEMMCMLRWFRESTVCCEIICAAWVYIFLSLAFLTKCTTGFVWSIVLNNIIHKTNKCF